MTEEEAHSSPAQTAHRTVYFDSLSIVYARLKYPRLVRSRVNRPCLRLLQLPGIFPPLFAYTSKILK